MQNTYSKEGKTTIIVPIYNGEKYLARCIESILNQTYANIELLIVDDGSTDSTCQICDEYARRDQRIRYYAQSNQGVSSARNIGIHHASGEYLTFVDADDALCENAIETALQYLHEADADVVTYGWLRCDENGNCWETMSENFEVLVDPENILYRVLTNYSSCGGGYPWNKLWKTAALKRIQLFDPQLCYFEDLEWCVRMLLQIKRLVVCPKCLYCYSVHPLSVSNIAKNKETKEISYHQAMERILDNLRGFPRLSTWIENKYHPEIINGILFAIKNGYTKLYRYLLDRFYFSKAKIKAACCISVKMKTRYYFINLLFHFSKRGLSNFCTK